MANPDRQAMRGMRSSLLGILLNLVLALSKSIAGLLGHSFALVADGLESLADVLSGFAVYVGLKMAVQPPDEDHPYGHGKAEPFAALIVGLFLVLAAIFIAAESIHQIRTPHQLPAPYTLVVLAGVLVVKEARSDTTVQSDGQAGRIPYTAAGVIANGPVHRREP